VQQIHKDRRAKEASEITQIRAALFKEFASIFMYRKGDQKKIISKDDAILRHFRNARKTGAGLSIPVLIVGEGDEEGDEADKEFDRIEEQGRA
jgi:transcriptional regulator with PAS, ATPase and Fis domain